MGAIQRDLFAPTTVILVAGTLANLSTHENTQLELNYARPAYVELEASALGTYLAGRNVSAHLVYLPRIRQKEAALAKPYLADLMSKGLRVFTYVHGRVVRILYLEPLLFEAKVQG